MQGAMRKKIVDKGRIVSYTVTNIKIKCTDGVFIDPNALQRVGVAGRPTRKNLSISLLSRTPQKIR